MGNVCVHIVSNCVESKSSSWVRPTDLIMDNPMNQLSGKPPQQMVMSKEEKIGLDCGNIGHGDGKVVGNRGEDVQKHVQKQKSFTDSEASDSKEDEKTNETKSTEHKLAVETKPKPLVVSENVRKPHNVRRLLSAGLQAESVLKRKTGHLKEYYNLGNKLGHGQFGTTFLCVEKGTGTEYACKSIQKRKLETEEDVDDVSREVEIMYHLLGQPNVISIKGAYEDAVAVHMVMELCRGGELFDRIVERGYYTEREAAKLAKTILGVVQTCHSLGVMHRDLKPENFLFVNNQEDSPLKAIDFGLSVFFKPGETFTDIVGSPYYVAPEVLNKKYGPEADIWSAGVMIYVMLSGSAPFSGETEEDIFDEVLHGDLDLSSHPWPEVSESAKDLIKKMLERNPSRRLTGHQVLLHPWIRDEGVAPDRPLDPEILNRLKRFSATDKLKKMGLKVIAESLSEEKIHGLKETFKTIDKDQRGRITFKQLRSSLKNVGVNLDCSDISTLIHDADIDSNDKIDYREFTAMILSLRQTYEKEENQPICSASKCLEKDGSESVTQASV